MRAFMSLAPVAALCLALAGCGGAADVGDAEIVPATPTPADKPAETPPDQVAPDVKPGDPPRTAPAPEPAEAP